MIFLLCFLNLENSFMSTMTFEQLQEIASNALNISAQNASNKEALQQSVENLTESLQDFVLESRMSWARMEQMNAETHIIMRSTQKELKAQSVNLGRLIDSLNKKGNL
jgi:hypothetical protein